jgi:hypothetical protein
VPQVSLAIRRSALGLLPADFGPPLGARGPMLRAHEHAGNTEILAALSGRGDTHLARRIALAAAGIEEPDRGVAMPTAGGEHLPGPVLARMNALFDHDFSHVRIRRDRSAADAAADLDAHAFALGTDLFFGAGEFSPATPDGERLLVHELTHVVQADEGRLPTGGGVSSPSDPCEREAYGNEGKLGGKPAPVQQSADAIAASPTVSRAAEEAPAGAADEEVPSWEEEAWELVDLAADVGGLPPFAHAPDVALHEARRARAAQLAAEAVDLAEVLADQGEVAEDDEAEWDAVCTRAEDAIEAAVLSGGIWTLGGWAALLGLVSVVESRTVTAAIAQRSRELEADLQAGLDALRAAESDAAELGVQMVLGEVIDATATALIGASAFTGPAAIGEAVLIRFLAGRLDASIDNLLGPEAVAGKTGALGSSKEALQSVGAMATEDAPALAAAVAEQGAAVESLGKYGELLGGGLGRLETGLEGVQVARNLYAAYKQVNRANTAIDAMVRDWKGHVGPLGQEAWRNLVNISTAMPALVAALQTDVAQLAALEASLPALG